MKKIHVFLLTLLTLLFGQRLTAQVTVWSEDFNNGCTSNCLASAYGGWTVLDNVDGTTGSAPNLWYVSCAEPGGIAPPGCGGNPCASANATLHIGANAGAGGDQGTSFNETGAVNATYRMAVSPAVDLSGRTSVTLKFNFFAYGSFNCAEDRAQLRLSTDNGATWPAGFQYNLCASCCSACNGYSSGQWAEYSLTLPAAFDNNPNVRVGFHWRNNGNGSGTDPSVVIDDIRFEVTALPITLLNFEGSLNSSNVALEWTTGAEINASHFEVERARDAIHYEQIGTILPKGSPNASATHYSFNDTRVPLPNAYYRLRMVDKNGTAEYSSTVSVSTNTALGNKLALSHYSVDKQLLHYTLASPKEQTINIRIAGADGRELKKYSRTIPAGETRITHDLTGLAAGLYHLEIQDANQGRIAQKFTKSL